MDTVLEERSVSPTVRLLLNVHHFAWKHLLDPANESQPLAGVLLDYARNNVFAFGIDEFPTEDEHAWASDVQILHWLEDRTSNVLNLARHWLDFPTSHKPGEAERRNLAFERTHVARFDDLHRHIHDVRLLTELERRGASTLEAAQTVALRVEQDRVALEQLKQEIRELTSRKAQAELSGHFEKLAREQGVASWLFRAGASVLAITAGVVGVRLGPGTTGWGDALAHAAIVLAIGGLSAYVARLGSSHRLTADWARSIKVQMDSFEDFIATIDDSATRQRIHEEFARRVLGAPPTGSGDETPLPMGQLIELVAAARR